MAHARLSIIDTSDSANQPFKSTKGILVYNGEIYNYKELKKTALKDNMFQTSSDTEVLSKGLETYSIEFLKRIRGMFGFAYFNKETKELVLARDYYGEKPLYYSMGNDGCLYFSSTIKSLLEYREVNQTISKENFATYLAWGYYPQDITPFEGINKVAAGKILVFGLDHSELS